jgi:hypothetical protein
MHGTNIQPLSRLNNVSLRDTHILYKNMNYVILNSNTRDTLLTAEKNEWAVPYPDVARWISVSRANGGKTVAAADHPAGGS